MKITPLDIRQKRFPRRALNGLAVREVEGFLELLATEFEAVIKENMTLKDELRRSLGRLSSYEEREHTLQETMITAQRISSDIKDAAKKEAEIRLAEAAHQADKIVHGAHHKLVKVVEDINELKRQRLQFESQIRSVIDSHHKLLESFSTLDAADPLDDDNLAFLLPRRSGSEG